MLPDTGERYLSTPLFADIPADMTAEEIAIVALDAELPLRCAAAAPPATARRASPAPSAADAAAFVERVVNDREQPVVVVRARVVRVLLVGARMFAKLGIAYRSRRSRLGRVPGRRSRRQDSRRARRPRRHAHLPSGPRGLRHGARPRLLQLPPRRRDQPRAGEGAVGAARGHAGAPGDDRPPDVPRPVAVPRRSQRRTRSSPRAPTRSPRRRSTGSCSRCSWTIPHTTRS